MRSRVIVVEPPKSISLVTLYEFKLALNISTADSPSDNAYELLIQRTSDEIATYCNRLFARQRVIEDIDSLGSDTLQLTLFPVRTQDIVSCMENSGGVLSSGYALDERTGIITRIGTGARWLNPVRFEYTGGYDLPGGAPPALKQATLLLSRESYNQSVRGDSSIRMISHKESRIMYHPPSALAGASSGAGGTTSRRAANDLLVKFTRFAI